MEKILEVQKYIIVERDNKMFLMPLLDLDSCDQYEVKECITDYFNVRMYCQAINQNGQEIIARRFVNSKSPAFSRITIEKEIQFALDTIWEVTFNK